LPEQSTSDDSANALALCIKYTLFRLSNMLFIRPIADASLSKSVSAAELIDVIHRVAKDKVHRPPRDNPMETGLG
jgi:hypothetical protein